ncbi:hypothetical protein ACV7K8_005001 [Escherichia coli]|nr:hypothetical protein [Escherichia coli]
MEGVISHEQAGHRASKNHRFVLFFSQGKNATGINPSSGGISRQHDEQAAHPDTASRRYYDFRNTFSKA